MTAHRARKRATRAQAVRDGQRYTAALRAQRPAGQPAFTARIGRHLDDDSAAEIALPDNHPPVLLVVGQTGSGYTRVTTNIGEAFRTQAPHIQTHLVDPHGWAGTGTGHDSEPRPADEGLTEAIEAALTSPAPSLVVYACDLSWVPNATADAIRRQLHHFARRARSANARLVLGVNRLDHRTITAVHPAVHASVVCGWGTWGHWLGLWEELGHPEPQDTSIMKIGGGWLNTSNGSRYVDFLKAP